MTAKTLKDRVKSLEERVGRLEKANPGFGIAADVHAVPRKAYANTGEDSENHKEETRDGG